MEVTRLAYALGAEIRGVDIFERLSQEAIKSIRQFGPLDGHAATPDDQLDGYPELLEVSTIPKNGNPLPTRTAGRDWHSDYAYTSRPAASSMLICLEKPNVGGDTMFCNKARAYDELSDRMEAIIDELNSVYDFNKVSSSKDRTVANLAEYNRINPPISHPSVRIHDESGKKALYVSDRTSHFDGMALKESAPLIKYLCKHATRPENVYRHQWRIGDLDCWDNRTTMHLALGNFDPLERRRMHRATVQGQEIRFYRTAGDLVPFLPPCSDLGIYKLSRINADVYKTP